MAYTISESGSKADVMAKVRQRAESQKAGLPSQEERDGLAKAIDEAEDYVGRFAGENDSVSVTISGHASQTDTALAMQKSCAVSISRAAGAPAPAPTDDREVTGATPAATRSAAPRI